MINKKIITVTHNFNSISLQLTKSIGKDIKKTQGIYFTPKSISKRLVSTALSFISNTHNIDILEPSCGSCEFVSILDELVTDVNITGVEYNDQIYDAISLLTFKNNVSKCYISNTVCTLVRRDRTCTF